jgi:hypothetical protein
MDATKMKFRKIAGVRADLTTAYTVNVGDTFIGTVESERSTKTGFRHGRCVGQVPCWRWMAKDAQGVSLDRASGFMGKGSQSRYQAAVKVRDAYEAKTLGCAKA